MGTTVIGGMAAATAIAIFIIPALFVLVERMAQRRGAALSLLFHSRAHRRQIRCEKLIAFASPALSFGLRRGAQL